MGLNFGNALEVGRLFASMGIDTAEYNRGLDDAEHRAHTFGQRLAGSFQRVAETATGVLIGQALPRVIGGLQSMATEALSSVASYERLGMALENLAKRDILAAGISEKMVSAGQVRIQLTAAEREKLEDLGRQRDILAIKMKEEELRHQELVKRYGEEGLATQRHALEMAGMRDKYEELNATIGKLESKQGTLVEQFKKVTNQTITDAQAKELASKASEDLLAWIEMLAVKSPFEAEGVESAFRMANSYGFVANAAADLAVKTGQMTQAQRDSAVTAERLTQTLIDFAAGSGAAPETMNRVAMALGQIKANGKLAGQDVMQLTSAGIAVDKILAKAFGKSTAEIVSMREKGLIPADEAIQAIVESMESDFAGAAAAQAGSLTGLISGLNDVKKIKLREFFINTFQSIQPYLSKFLDFLMSPEIKANIAAIGEALGNVLSRALGFVGNLFGMIGRLRDAGDDVRKSVTAMADLRGWLTRMGITTELITLLGKIGESFGRLKDTVLGMLAGLRGAGGGVTILDMVNQAIKWLVDNWGAVEGALKGIGMALVAGGVLAAVAGLASALMTLINPVTLLIALAAGIGAAWETNFLGIRDTVQPILDKLAAVFETIKTKVGEVVSAFQAGGLAGALQGLGVPAEVLTRIGTAFDTIRTKAGEVIGAFQEGGLAGALQQLGVPQETLSTLAATFERIGNFLANLFAPTIERLKQGFADFTAGLPSLQPLLEPLMGAFQNLWNALQPVFQVLGAIAGVVGGVLVGAFNLLLEIVAGVMGSLPELIGNAITIVTEIINGLADLIRGVVDVIKKIIEGDWAGAWEAAKETVSGLWEHIKNIFTTMVDTIVTIGADVIAAIATWSQNIVDKVKEFFGIASPSTVFAQLGTDLVNGLLGGIMSMAGTVLSGVIDFFDTNIKRAVDFASMLVDAGKAIIQGLWDGISGMGQQFADWLIGWLKTWVPGVVLDFLGIKSPSKMFIEIGKQIIAGLIEGIKSMGSAAANAMLDTLNNVINAVNGIVQVLENINSGSPIVNLREKLAAIIASIQTIVLMFRDLAKYYGTAAGGDALRSAKAVLDPLAEVAQALSGVLNVFKPLSELPETGDMRSRLTVLRQVIVDVVNTLGVIGEGIGQGARARLKAIALDLGLIMTTIGGIFEPLRQAFDFMVYLESARLPNIGTKMRGVISLLMDLAYSLAEVVSGIGEDVLARAATVGAQLQTILAPWRQIIDVVAALAGYTDRVIGTAANQLAGKMRRMALMLVTWADTLEPGQLERAGKIAEQFEAVLGPWQKAIEVVRALAGHADRVIGPIANRLASQMLGLARNLQQWADQMTPAQMARAVEAAEQFQAILEPWQQAIDVVRALAGHADRVIGPIANRLASQMLGLARNLQQWADQMTPAQMARAVEAAGNFTQILAPWDKALDVVRSLKTWRILPDIESRFDRLLRFWREAIFTLARVATVVDRDGMAAAVRFAQAIGDIAEGLRAALELGLAVPTHWEVPRAWAAFEQWVMDVFQSFYDWVNRTTVVAVAGGGTIIVPAFSDEGMGAMSTFAAALGDLMGALQTALELSLALPATWTVPAAWGTFEQWVMDVFTDFYDWITSWGAPPNQVPRFGDEEMDLVGQFAGALNDLMGALLTALQVATALPATWTVPAAWDTFEQWVRDVFEGFAGWILGWGTTNPVPIFNGEEMDLVGQFAGALNDLMGALLTALQVATALPATWTVPAAWGAFQDWVRSVFMDFATWLLNWGSTNPVPIFTEGELDLIGQFAGAMEALFNGLAAALGIVSSLPTTWVAPGQTWDAFMTWVQDTMEYFIEYVATYLTQNPGTAPFQAVTEFGNAMQAVFSGLQAALDLFRDINTWVGPGSQFQQRLTVFLGLVETTFNQVEEYVRTNFTATALQLVTTFAGALSAVVNALSAALSLFSALAGTEPGVFTPGTATLEFERRMQALMMAIGLTIEAFQTYIATEPNQLWFPTAASFFGAVDQMMGILRSALDLFADLENANLPDPQEIQDFVDAVLALFVAFATGLLGTGTNIGNTATNIEGMVGDMPGGILAYVDPFAQAGSSTIGSLAGGMIAGSVFLQDSAATIYQELDDLAEWLEDQAPLFETAGLALVTGLATGLTAAAPLGTIAAAGTTALNSLWNAWNPEANQAGVWAGQQAAAGIVTGLQSGSGAIWQAAYNLAQQIIAGLNAGLIIGSPSRATAQIGAWAGEGLVDGFASQADLMAMAVDDMIGGMVDPMQSLGLALVTAFAGGMSGGFGAVDAVLNSLGRRVTDLDPIHRMATLLEPPIGLSTLSHRLDISNERRVHLTVDFQNADYLPPSVINALTNELVRAVRTNA